MVEYFIRGSDDMNKLYGIIYVILSSVCFSIMPIFAKFCYKNGMNCYNVLFYRFLFCSIILFIYLKIKKVPLKITKEQLKIMLRLAIIGYTFTCFLLFLSYEYISAGMSTIIHFTYPIIVTVASFVIYKDKITYKKVISLTTAIIGIYILIGVKGQHLDKTGILVAFASAIFYAYYIIGTSNKNIKKLDSFVITLYISAISSVCFFVACLFKNTIYFQVNFQTVFNLLCLSVFSTIIALMALVKGVKIIGPSTASILNTLEPILSIILGIVILNEDLTVNIAIGSILVLFAIIYLTICENKSA